MPEYDVEIYDENAPFDCPSTVQVIAESADTAWEKAKQELIKDGHRPEEFNVLDAYLSVREVLKIVV